MRFLSKLFSLWDDPVLSAVIAAIIFATLATIVGPIRRALVKFATLVFGLPTVRTTLQVTVDDMLPHVPWIRIEAYNRGWRAVELSSVDFTTKQSWDMPDPFREGVTTPVIPLLPRGAPYVLISEEKGSVATLPLGVRTKAFRSSVVTARLVTDHSPGYAMGVFPFHLGVVIKWNRGRRQRALSDVVVSLHGQSPISSLTVSEPIFSFPYDPGKLRQSANEALSLVLAGATCPGEVRKALESLAALQPS